jgi:predicted ArsR family transcriptional regulator
VIRLHLEQLSETRRVILSSIKKEGSATISELANFNKLSGEAVRQHLVQLERDGWIKRSATKGSHEVGRPSMRYSLTQAGEHLFPKHYDALALEVLDTIIGNFGDDALNQILSSMTEARVMKWEPRLRGLSLPERVEVLKGLYLQDDAYMDVEYEEGRIRLIERNCPFYSVAMRSPVLCSISVSLLTRLLGYQVVREERFQDGDGRCVFRVLLDQPVDNKDFVIEKI